MATKPDRPKRKARGGSLGIDWEQNTRKKIQSAGITKRLIGFVNGEISLEPAQVTAGLGLLKKTLPDLSSVTLGGDKDNPVGVLFKTVYEATGD